MNIVQVPFCAANRGKYLFLVIILTHPLSAQFLQQGDKLTDSGGIGMQQGFSVALSADGNTAIVGAPKADGAAIIYVRTNGRWSQQGKALVGTGAQLSARQGTSVALSADGNTAIVGGPTDYKFGAAWVFTRTGGVWTQQGGKLFASNILAYDISGPGLGYSVALSADGNTALLGGPLYLAQEGGAWVFTRSNGVWTQQGGRLLGTGGIRSLQQGAALALSADGNTALIGGAYDNGYVGAVWVFVRNNGVWSQQGNKLVPDSAAPVGYFGRAVSLSADGNTALVGTNGSDVSWIFNRTNGVWTQGTELSGAGESGKALQGYSVALSADGNTALAGGWQDDGNKGAGWIFTRKNGTWSQDGSKLVATGQVGAAGLGMAVAISGDGNTALLGGPLDNASCCTSVGAAWVFAHDNRALTLGTLLNAGSLSQGSGAPNTILSAFGSFSGCADGPRVYVDGVQTSVFFSSSLQINFLLPASVASEPSASLTLSCGDLTSAPLTLPIAGASPAIFTVTQNGTGQAAVVNQDGSVASPSLAGTTISLFGTGFGLLGPAGPDGLARLAAPVTATVGGLPAAVLYAGEAPGFTPGLQQINIRIPAVVPRGPNVTVGITSAGVSTQSGVTINIP